MLSVCEAHGSGRQGLKKIVFSFPSILWIVNVRERKLKQKNKLAYKAPN